MGAAPGTSTRIDRATVAHLARLAREEALDAAPSVEDGRFRVPPNSSP